MSAETVVVQMLEALAERDLEGFLAMADEDIALVSAMTPAEGGDPYRGRDGIERWWSNTLETWDDYRLEPKKLLELGDHVLGVFDLAGRGRTSGLALRRDLYVAFEVRRGKIAWVLAEFELPTMLRGLAARIDGAS
jgi:ketosteroid isomerase-like protein